MVICDISTAFQNVRNREVEAMKVPSFLRFHLHFSGLHDFFHKR